jgi:AcrR family transcriptional regulator
VTARSQPSPSGVPRDPTGLSSPLIAAGRNVLGAGEGSSEQIAAEAGVGIATLYRHFPNREALVRALLDDILRPAFSH